MQESAAAQHRLLAPETKQQLDELHQFYVCRLQIPSIPTDVVVLAIGVVIAPLGASDLIATEEHRRPLGEEKGRQEIPSLAGACFHNGRVVSWSLDAVIGRDVVIRAVEIRFSIRQVVFALVRNEIL